MSSATPRPPTRWSVASAPSVLVLLAQEDAGMVALHRIPVLAGDDGLARITALVVRSRWRGRGVARALLRASEQAARKWECRGIEVSSARRPERMAAHDVDRAAGFVDTSQQSVRYWKTLRP